MPTPKRYPVIKIIFLLSISLGLTSQLDAQLPYTKYCNARYSFCVKYPVTFGMEPAPFNNDGRVFYDRDGFYMHVYGSQNALLHSLYDEMRSDERDFDQITYRVKRRNWYILSGYQGSNILYKKTYISRDGSIFYHLDIRYPIELKQEYDQIVTKASRSFKIRY